MRGHKRKSPFAELVEYIEFAAYSNTMECQLHELDHARTNMQFLFGYRAAINEILLQALAIRSRGLAARQFVPLDLTDEATTERLLAALEGGD